MDTSMNALQSRGRIVAGIDGSQASIAALKWALRYAGLIGASTELVEAWNWTASPSWALIPSDFDPKISAEQVLDILIGQMRREFPNQPIDGKVIQGQAAQLLVEASAGADLLVLANSGQSEIVGMLLGSVSEYCVAHAHCPVVVYRGDAVPETQSPKAATRGQTS